MTTQDATPDRAYIRGSTVTDVYALHDRLKPSDLVELDALGILPHTALMAGLAGACFTLEHEGTPSVMFGVSATNSGINAVWMLSDDRIGEFLPFFHRATSAFIAHLRKLDREVANITLETNTETKRWLERIGFTMGPLVDHNGHDFRYFSLERFNV